MIVKCGIYVEFMEKLSPEQVSQVTKLIEDHLYEHTDFGRKSSIKFSETKINFEVLTWRQVKNRIGEKQTTK